MFKVTKYPHGTFSWADCVSTDASKGKHFYADLMGWEIDDVPIGEGMVYTMFKHDGDTVAALNQIQPELQKQGIPSHWNSYVTVDDVDAVATKAKELGATIIAEPFDVFEDGRMAFIQDPTGARVAFWQAKNSIGAYKVNTPGAMAWNELMTRDSQKAVDFYGQLLGWEFRKDQHIDYHYIENKGRMNGGIIQMTEEFGDMPPNWTIYFSVADIDKTVEKAKTLGGNVPMAITDAQGVGRFAVIIDPQGAAASFIQLTEPQPWSS